MPYNCFVCGYDQLPELPRLLGGKYGSCEICPSCGFQFGVSEDEASIRAWREKWIAGGLRWHGVTRPPADWNPQEQVKPFDPHYQLAAYLSGVVGVEPLSPTEEAELFQRLGAAENWDDAAELAARRLIEHHLSLVRDIVQRHSTPSADAMLDLIQEGNMGLMNAVKTFAKQPRGEFSAYASICIEDAISKALNKP